MTTLEYSSFTSDDENVLFQSESSRSAKKNGSPLFLQCLLLIFLIVITVIFTVATFNVTAHSKDDSNTQEYYLNRIRNRTQNAWAERVLVSAEHYPNFIFSAMSTLYLMDLQEEFNEGRKWIEQEFTFAEHDAYVKVHDVITNYLGGLLSLYGLTSDDLFLKKATEVGDVIIKQAFNTKTGNLLFYRKLFVHNFHNFLGFLYNKINPKQKTFQNFPDLMPISRSGFYQPELILLAHLTNNSILFEHLQTIATQATKYPHKSHFYFWTEKDTRQPMYIKASDERPAEDIFYNLLRSYLLSDRHDTTAISLLNSTLSSTLEHSFKYKVPNALTYALSNYLRRENFNETLMYAQDCALGALLTVSATELNQFNGSIRDPIRRHYFNKYFKAGVNITKTCYGVLKKFKKVPFEFTVHHGIMNSFNGTNSDYL